MSNLLVPERPIMSRGMAGADMMIRTDGDGRTVYGLAVPFNSPQRVSEFGRTFTEQFRMGAFAKTIAENGQRVKFIVNHNRQALPLGRATMLREDPAGLIGEFKVSATTAGDEALELIRDGALDAFSIGFAPVQADPRNFIRNLLSKDGDISSGVTWTEVHLREVSATGFPAYAEATIGGVRTELSPTDEAVQAALDAGMSPEDAIEHARGTSDGADDEAATHGTSGMTRGERDRVLRQLQLEDT